MDLEIDNEEPIQTIRRKSTLGSKLAEDHQDIGQLSKEVSIAVEFESDDKQYEGGDKRFQDDTEMNMSHNLPGINEHPRALEVQGDNFLANDEPEDPFDNRTILAKRGLNPDA